MATLIASALESANFEVAKASNVASARLEIEEFDPDVALIDISLGDGPNGIDLANMLRESRPDIGVLILTKHPDNRTAGLRENLPAGCGFLRKESIGDLVLLIESIDMVLSDNSSAIRQDLDPDRPLAALTSKQIEVIRMVAQGYTNAEIAARVGVSNSAIEQRLASIFRALGVADLPGISPRSEAMRLFIQAVGLPARP